MNDDWWAHGSRGYMLFAVHLLRLLFLVVACHASAFPGDLYSGSTDDVLRRLLRQKLTTEQAKFVEFSKSGDLRRAEQSLATASMTHLAPAAPLALAHACSKDNPRMVQLLLKAFPFTYTEIQMAMLLTARNNAGSALSAILKARCYDPVDLPLIWASALQHHSPKVVAAMYNSPHFKLSPSAITAIQTRFSLSPEPGGAPAKACGNDPRKEEILRILAAPPAAPIDESCTLF